MTDWLNSGAGVIEISPAGQLHLQSTNNTFTEVHNYLPVPSSYTLETRFKVDTFGSAVVLAAYDGLYRLHVYFSTTGIRVRNAQNTMVLMHAWNSDTDWHTYRFEVDNGMVEMFMDGTSLGTTSLNANSSSNQLQYFVQGTTPTECHVDWLTLTGPPPVPIGVIADEEWNSLSAWTLLGGGAKEINPASQLHVQNSTSTVATVDNYLSIPGAYTLETVFKVDAFGSEVGLAVYDGAYRLMVYFTGTGVKIKNAAGTLVTMYAWSSDTNWHDYRFVVNNGTVEMFVDEVSTGTTSIQPSTTSDKLEYWVKGPTPAECHVDWSILYAGSYSFNDSFSNYADNSNPDYWMESGYRDVWNYTGDYWKVKDVAGNKVYHADCLTNAAARTLLHVHGRDVKFETKVQVNSYNTATGSFCIIARGNHSDDSRIAAQYTFSDQTWRLIEKDNVAATTYIRATSGVVALGNGWNTVKLETNGSTVTLSLNGAPLLSSSDFVHVNWGRVGLQANYVDAYFDDIAYSGDGRVEKGVNEYTFQKGSYGSDMVKLPNGKLIMDQTAVYESSDNGLSWAKLTKTDALYKWTSANMVVLQNGDILAIQNYWENWGYPWPPDNNKYHMINHSFISHDSGVTWEGPFPIQTEWKYRITMPNKVSQAANGRIFFASGECTDKPPAAAGVWIYYSDDGGRTWTRSQTLHDKATFGIDLQEGKVVGISGNTLKAFFRTTLGSLYESLSTDNGVTWARPTATTLVSPQCSFNIERDAATGYYYMLWEYNDLGIDPAQTWPRYRVSLAVSTDNTATWKFLMDLDDQPDEFLNLHMNHSLRVVDGNIWCEVPTCYMGVPASDWYIRVYKVKISDQNPYVVFPALH